MQRTEAIFNSNIARLQNELKRANEQFDIQRLVLGFRSLHAYLGTYC